ncbi:MogA/MoaB family molybdenum cofactor biosynthesis protein [Cohnella thailandensis]|uniref:Molybdenum cofactor biosynthesis protein B n=1 Tax=Cohnella thailandensis TaxID=557557 RepID=A0A841STS1_9BACL|nr:molybdenum cofactor biosynthesis protein B [Cohnella thailandensis]MBB6633618.1 molybdenum cofactor biosynthesis protein MoaB [Cohnella thailandensis]MBP1976402.1 molybdenum cofactor biosynthesis protein B [Cohnella thailandensis]
MSNSPSTEQHRREAPASVACLIITVSDTRTPETDKSGQLAQTLLEENGYVVAERKIVPDEYENIKKLVEEAAADPAIEAVLLNGGTGIAGRDTTYEAVRDVLQKEMPGFGEIFRMLSFAEDIGSAAILSRAIAGTVGTTAVFSMPGSTGAVKLAMTRLIVPELRHVMRELYKDSLR